MFCRTLWNRTRRQAAVQFPVRYVPRKRCSLRFRRLSGHLWKLNAKKVTCYFFFQAAQQANRLPVPLLAKTNTINFYGFIENTAFSYFVHVFLVYKTIMWKIIVLRQTCNRYAWQLLKCLVWNGFLHSIHTQLDNITE